MKLSFSFSIQLCLILFLLFSSGLLSKVRSAEVISPQKPLAIEYFTNKSKVRNAKISPDGKTVMVVLMRNEEEVFGVYDVAKKKLISLIGVSGGGRHISNFHWVNNSRIVYTVYTTTLFDQSHKTAGELYAVNLDSSQHEMIFGFRAGDYKPTGRIRKKISSYAGHKIISYLPNDDENILIAYYPWKIYGRYWRPSLDSLTQIRKLNIYNGKLTRVMTLPLSMATAIVDNAGDVRFAMGNEENGTFTSYYKGNKSSKWQEFKLENFEGKYIYPFSFSEDNQKVYITANVADGTRGLYQFDLEKNKTEKLFHDKSIDMSRITFDFSHRRVISVATERTLPNYSYLEKNNKKSKIHKKLMRAFKGQDVLITSAVKDGSKLIAFVYSDTNPGDYYIFDTKSFKANYLMSRNSWVDREKLVATQFLTIDTRDGKEIYGYLTQPQNKNDELLPLVVLLHGGPHGIRDEWSYSWQVQLLANRGYAVLQVNYRGSGGFGKAFEEVGYRQWGGLMQDDVTDATQAMIDNQVADPNRICIMGGSYGAYAALMGAVREPNLYKCAIGSAGVYDLPLMFENGDIPFYVKGGLAYLEEVLGDDLDDLKNRSPVYNAEKITANILLVHGKQDERAPITHANKLKAAFDKINKPYGWLEIKDEGHGYRSEPYRKMVYQRIIDFLDNNIGDSSLASQ